MKRCRWLIVREQQVGEGKKGDAGEVHKNEPGTVSVVIAFICVTHLHAIDFIYSEN